MHWLISAAKEKWVWLSHRPGMRFAPSASKSPSPTPRVDSMAVIVPFVTVTSSGSLYLPSPSPGMGRARVMRKLSTSRNSATDGPWAAWS